MNIKKLYQLAGLALLILALASCSKAPKHVKLIPDNAMMVVKIDAKKVIDASGAANNDKLKKFIEKNLKDSEMSSEAKKLAQEIVDNPLNAGIDLMQPLFIFVDNSGKEAPVLVGAVDNKNKLTEMLNTLAKESGAEKVSEKEKLNVFVNNNVAVFFDADMLYITAIEAGADVNKMAKAVQAKFEADEKNSMAANEDMNKLFEKQGMMQMLVSGAALENLPQTSNTKNTLPQGLELKDASYIVDLDMKKGTGTLSYEILAKSDKWKQIIDKGDKLAQPIKGRFADYVEKDGIALFANMNGQETLNFFKEMGADKEMDKNSKEMFEKVIGSLDGDMVLSLTGFNVERKMPELFAYITTKDASLVDLVAQITGGAKKQGDNKYELELGDNFYLNFGMKENATYFCLGNAESAFAKAKAPFKKEDIKGAGSYFYANAAFLNKFASQMNGPQAENALELMKQLDYAEVTYAGKGKAAMNVYTKDKDHTLLELLIDFGLKMAE